MLQQSFWPFSRPQKTFVGRTSQHFRLPYFTLPLVKSTNSGHTEACLLTEVGYRSGTKSIFCFAIVMIRLSGHRQVMSEVLVFGNAYAYKRRLELKLLGLTNY